MLQSQLPEADSGNVDTECIVHSHTNLFYDPVRLTEQPEQHM